MIDDCLFCKIIARDIPSTIVYEDDEVFAFNDINPQAPIHVLIVPKVHISKLDEMSDGESLLVGRLFLAAKNIAKAIGVKEEAFRLVVNNGAFAGQEVFHLHIHLLADRSFSWPPG